MFFILLFLVSPFLAEAKAIRIIKDLVAASNQTCVIYMDGGMKCWGNNSYGQLGLPLSTSYGTDPSHMGKNLKDISLGKGFKVKNACLGGSHTCAVSDQGKLKCWGNNSDGQLGLGNNITQMAGENLAFVEVAKMDEVIKVSCGTSHTCSLLKSGELKCWGYGGYGQLGYEDNESRGSTQSTRPKNIATIDLGERKIVDLISSGNFNCVLTDKNLIACWGINDLGQLGLGNEISIGDNVNEMGQYLNDVNFDEEALVKQMSLGPTNVCVLLKNGEVKCWGQNSFGELGVGFANKNIPVPLKSLFFGKDLKVVRLSESKPNCAIFDNKKVKCWGRNDIGQLGVEDKNHRGDGPKEMGDNLPWSDMGLSVIKVVSGANHSCALLVNNTVKCWGLNVVGQLGLGDTKQRGDTVGSMGKALPFVDLGDNTEDMNVPAFSNLTSYFVR